MAHSLLILCNQRHFNDSILHGYSTTYVPPCFPCITSGILPPTTAPIPGLSASPNGIWPVPIPGLLPSPFRQFLSPLNHPRHPSHCGRHVSSIWEASFPPVLGSAPAYLSDKYPTYGNLDTYLPPSVWTRPGSFLSHTPPSIHFRVPIPSGCFILQNSLVPRRIFQIIRLSISMPITQF